MLHSSNKLNCSQQLNHEKNVADTPCFRVTTHHRGASTTGVSNAANGAVVDRVIDPTQEVEQGGSTSWVIELNSKGDLDPVRLHH